MNTLKTHHRGRYLSLVERDGWEFSSRSNASGVVVLIAVTDEDRILLVEQFRTPVGSTVIELPAGLVGDEEESGETVIDAAQRELLEETGYEAELFEEVLSCPSSAGMSDEIITFVRARRLIRSGPGGGDGSEDITVHEVPLSEADRWLKQRLTTGTPLDPKIYAALYWLDQESAQ